MTFIAKHFLHTAYFSKIIVLWFVCILLDRPAVL